MDKPQRDELTDRQMDVVTDRQMSRKPNRKTDAKTDYSDRQTKRLFLDRNTTV